MLYYRLITKYCAHNVNDGEMCSLSVMISDKSIQHVPGERMHMITHSCMEYPHALAELQCMDSLHSSALSSLRLLDYNN